MSFRWISNKVKPADIEPAMLNRDRELSKLSKAKEEELDRFLVLQTEKYSAERPNPRTLSGWQLLATYKVIDPAWKYKIRWDIIMIMVLLFTALVTPFEVAFLEPAYNMLFYLNRGVDLFFLSDMVINFFLVYSDNNMSKVVYEPGKIAKHYLNTWFPLDLISTLPFDLLVLGGNSDSRLRLLRLLKLARMGRAWRMLGPGGVLQSLHIGYHTLNLVMFLMLVLLASHWMACGWRLVPELELADQNWKTRYGFEDDIFEENTDKILKVYVKSLYWSVMTITTIGYGDILPETTLERWFDVISMLVGGLLFGYIVGAVGNVVQQTSARENQYYQYMGDLKHFMDELKLPHQLQAELHMYFQRLHASIDVQTYSYYVELLSPALRARMLLYMNKTWITRVPHFKGAPQDFVVQVAAVLTRHVYPPKEEIIAIGSDPRELFIVNRGIAAGNNRLYTVGQIVGIDALFHKSAVRQHATHAITYLECSRLDRTDLFSILDAFPVMKKRFRLLAIKAIFKEEVMSYAVAVRQLRMKTLSYEQGLKFRTASSLFSDSDRNLLTQMGRFKREDSLDSSDVDTPKSEVSQSGRFSQTARRGSRSHSLVGGMSPMSPLRQQMLKSTPSKLCSLDLPMGDDDDKRSDISSTEKQYISDLFKRNNRTEHYTKKLEALYPPIREERERLLRSCLVIQAFVRRWRMRAAQAAADEERQREEEQMRWMRCQMGENQAQLDDILRKQSSMFEWMSMQELRMMQIDSMLQAIGSMQQQQQKEQRREQQ